MNPRLLRGLRYAGFGVGYLMLLTLFIRLTFPYQRVRDRIVAEFHASQKPPSPRTLSIDDVSGHWLFGVELEGLSLTTPPPPGADDAAGTEEKEAPKPSVLRVDEAFASISLVRLLIGTLHVDFGAGFGEGDLDGAFQQSDEESSIELELNEVDISTLGPLEEIVGLPLEGALSGQVNLTMPEGKMSQADGMIELSISDLKVGDGKAKIRSTIALPRLDAGALQLSADVNAGQLEVKTFSAKGKDFELDCTGSLALRDPVDQSLSDLRLRFKFTDAYKNKNDLTKGLFGDPSSKIPGLFDLDPSIKRAKTADGFYGWRVSGQLGRMNFRPSPENATSRSTGSTRRRPSTKTKLGAKSSTKKQ